MFVPGDVAVFGVNSNIASCTGGTSAGDDEISIVFFHDITTGTTLDLTDNGWERCYSDAWGGDEGFLRVRYIGTSTIPNGTILTIQLLANSPYFNVLNTASTYDDWVVDIRYNSLIFNTNGDQIYFMQGGIWNQSSSNNATYVGGTLLFAFNTNDTWTSGICTDPNNSDGEGRSQNSGLMQNMECFNMIPRAATDYLKYSGDMSNATQKEWILRLNDPDNWNAYSGCDEYNEGLPNYLTTNTITIDEGTGADAYSQGVWTGAANTDWFYCGNWGNFMVPDETVDVTLPNNDEFTVGNDCVIGAPPEGYTKASCKKLVNNLSSSSILVNDASSLLDIHGDFTNNATFSHTAGSITFKGNSEQTISGTTSPDFYNLQINNSSSTGVVLNKEISVAGTLSLTDGLIIGNATLIMKAGSSPTGASNTSFVDGPVRKVGNTAFIFPTGDIQGSDYVWAPIGIASPGVVTDAFTAEYIFDSPDNIGLNNLSNGTNMGEGLVYVSDLEFWQLNRDAGSSTPAVTLYWKDVLRSDIERESPHDGDTLSDLTVAHWNSVTGKWENMGGVASATWPSGEITSNVVFPNYSPITFGSKTAKNPLPVEMMNFNGKYNYSTGYVDLKWATSTEINNSHFIVQRSTEARNFTDISIVSGSGNSNSINHYSETDKNPLLGVNYYRLKQIDYNGDSKLSQIVVIDIEKENNISVTDFIFSTNYLSFTINTTDELPIVIKIADMTGKIIYTNNTHLLDDLNKIIIPTTGYTSGLYCLMINYSHKQINYKFVIR